MVVLISLPEVGVQTAEPLEGVLVICGFRVLGKGTKGFQIARNNSILDHANSGI